MGCSSTYPTTAEESVAAQLQSVLTILPASKKRLINFLYVIFSRPSYLDFYFYAAMALARLCYDTLMADGRKAAVAAKAGACTKALENIVEANTYLSGIGFESGGLAGAHAIHNGLTAIPETHAFYHGEKVAFGTLVQLVLEDEHFGQIQEVVRFCTDVGLPTTLADLGIAEIKPEQIHAVAELACAPSDTLGNMPFAVTPDAVYDAILGADAIGRKYKELHA